jgi:serine/threonine-protein kinase RsbW/stage II sporulation protein AB (anti-sigma F factor)
LPPEAEPQISHSWPAVAESVGEARAAVASFATAAGADSDTLISVKLAVSEAVTNAVLHAYLDHDTPGHVHVRAGHDRSGDLWVVVADDGRGMLPRPDSPGGGLGLPLIAQMTAAFAIDRAESGGTMLHMRFQRPV